MATYEHRDNNDQWHAFSAADNERIDAAYRGFWGPYVSLADAEAAPFFELPPQPWDKAHRPALVEAQKRDYARRASMT